jgi:glutaminase
MQQPRLSRNRGVETSHSLSFLNASSHKIKKHIGRIVSDVSLTVKSYKHECIIIIFFQIMFLYFYDT